MKTVLTKDVDGHKVVVGIDRPLIDQEATKKKIEGMIEKTDEHKAVEQKSQEMQRLSSARHALVLEGREAHKNGDHSRVAKVKYDIELRDQQIEQLNGELVKLVNARTQKEREIFASHAVYFEPKTGEEIITDDEANVIMGKVNALKSDQVLTRDGVAIDDLRGKKYVKDGRVQQVKKLGEKPDGPLVEDVTPEEFENMRLASMTTEQIHAELDAMIEGLASQAAAMRSKLEIQGEADALSQAQSWYEEEKAKAESKYSAAEKK